MSTTKLKAIQTSYRGHAFRSRLEARWAVFFDALGVPWHYEPEGFDLPSGRYLPDFYLPHIDAYFEVKGRRYTDHEFTLMCDLSDVTKSGAFIAWGDLPKNPDHNGYDTTCGPGGTGHRGIVTLGDYDYAWTACSSGDHVGIQYEARGDRIGCNCPTSSHGDKGYNGNHHRIINAYNVAHSARFEHGEKPAIRTRRTHGIDQ